MNPKNLLFCIILFVLCAFVAAAIGVLAALFRSKTLGKSAIAVFPIIPTISLIVMFILESIADYKFNALKDKVDELCKTKGGDVIYKTVNNVDGILQMRPKKKELQSNLNMTDPYARAQGDAENMEGLVGTSIVREIAMFARKSDFYKGERSAPLGKYGYRFVEQVVDDQKYLRMFLVPTGVKVDSGVYSLDKLDAIEDEGYKYGEIYTENSISRYGYLTEDLTTKEMREDWIGGGRIKIVDLKTNEILAVRTGYFLAKGAMYHYGDEWNDVGYQSCPSHKFGSAYGLMKFLHAVLKPPQGFSTDEELKEIARN